MLPTACLSSLHSIVSLGGTKRAQNMSNLAIVSCPSLSNIARKDMCLRSRGASEVPFLALRQISLRETNVFSFSPRDQHNKLEV